MAENELAGPDELNIGFDQAAQLFQTNKAVMLVLDQWYFDEQKVAQEIFSGADVSSIQEKLNREWNRAVQALK